jgi:hypothetical protein
VHMLHLITGSKSPLGILGYSFFLLLKNLILLLSYTEQLFHICCVALQYFFCRSFAFLFV